MKIGMLFQQEQVEKKKCLRKPYFKNCFKRMFYPTMYSIEKVSGKMEAN